MPVLIRTAEVNLGSLELDGDNSVIPKLQVYPAAVEFPIGKETRTESGGVPLMNMESTELRPGYSISRIIRGGWQLAGGHGPVNRERAIADFNAFVSAGIDTFDCADIYTGVESMIGEFVAGVRQQKGSDIASKIKIHTKLVPDLDLLKTCDASSLEGIVNRSLTRLRVERLDLVQFFWWDLSIGNPVDTLLSLKLLQDKGKIRCLGVTNWDVDQIIPFVESGLDIVSAQVQYSLLDSRPQNQLTDWCCQNQVKLLCYGTLAGGFLTEAWLGKQDPGFEFENRSLIKYRLIIKEFGSWDLFQTLLEIMKSIAVKHKVTVSAVAARYVLEQPQVGAVIIGARYAADLESTLSIFRFALDRRDHESLSVVLEERDGPSGAVYGLEGNRLGRHGRIMKYNLNAGSGL